MFPVAIPAIASLANTALQTWNRVAESRAAVKSQPEVDFQALLEKTKAVAGTSLVQGQPTTNFAHELQRQLGTLPEVKAALAANGPGTSVHFEVSANHQLSLVNSNGTKQFLALSPESQTALRQVNLPVNSSGTFSITLTSPGPQTTA